MDQAGDYANLEIRIQKRENQGYPVKLIVDHHQHFEGGYLKPDIVKWVPSLSPQEDGRKLFELLFNNEQLQQWGVIRGQSKGRRVRLIIDRQAPELHAIPWELLHDASPGLEPRALAADADTPFSRYWETELEPADPISERPIRMLAAIVNPEGLGDYGLGQIEVEPEKDVIREAVKKLGADQIVVDFLDHQVTLEAIEDKLRAGSGYHVFHLVAHGFYREKGGTSESALFLANRGGRVHPVKSGEFSAMIKRLAHQPHLVFLASCQSATRSSSDAFRGLAPGLMNGGAPALLAMQDYVSVRTARKFAAVFYAQLLHHGMVDLAGNQARAAILTAELPGGAIPVLFSRLPTNQLLAPGVPDAAPVITRQLYEPETVSIPAGEFLMGSDGHGISDYEGPQHRLHLPAYRIGRFPVTNAQYAEYIRHTGASISPRAGWELARVGQSPPETRLDHPVVGVSWDEAAAYCRWLSSETGRAYRLPTEAEWEKAARGAEDGRVYPWGDEAPDASRCNFGGNVGDTTPVGRYSPAGDSPYGLADMAGNVWEWTSTLWGRDRAEPDFFYPYPEAPDGRDDPPVAQTPHREYRLCRGGSFRDDAARLRCSARARFAADTHHVRRGFRVVLEP